VSITTDVVSSNLDQGGVQQYVIKFVSNLRPVGGFLGIVRFPPSTDKRMKYCTCKQVSTKTNEHNINLHRLKFDFVGSMPFNTTFNNMFFLPESGENNWPAAASHWQTSSQTPLLYSEYVSPPEMGYIIYHHLTFIISAHVMLFMRQSRFPLTSKPSWHHLTHRSYYLQAWSCQQYNKNKSNANLTLNNNQPKK
jgi:hypothetical protein